MKIFNVSFTGETAANLEPLQHNHIGKVHKGRLELFKPQFFRSLKYVFSKKIK